MAVMAALDNCVKRWRTALHVIVSAGMVAVLGLTTAFAAHAAAVTATLSVAPPARQKLVPAQETALSPP